MSTSLEVPPGRVSAHNVTEKLDSFTTRQQVFGCPTAGRVRVCVLYYDRSHKIVVTHPSPSRMRTRTAATRGLVASCAQVRSLSGRDEVIASVLLQGFSYTGFTWAEPEGSTLSGLLFVPLWGLFDLAFILSSSSNRHHLSLSALCACMVAPHHANDKSQRICVCVCVQWF